MGYSYDGQHRAWLQEAEPGVWLAGCRRCGPSLGPALEPELAAWVHGHDSAVACARRVAQAEDPTFAPTPPDSALTLAELKRLATEAELRFGPDAELMFPEEQPAVAYVFTAPSEEAWCRDPLGVLHLDGVGRIQFAEAGELSDGSPE
jgi:hypothetical protein